jgi:hypothetical protein
MDGHTQFMQTLHCLDCGHLDVVSRVTADHIISAKQSPSARSSHKLQRINGLYFYPTPISQDAITRLLSNPGNCQIMQAATADCTAAGISHTPHVAFSRQDP